MSESISQVIFKEADLSVSVELENQNPITNSFAPLAMKDQTQNGPYCTILRSLVVNGDKLYSAM